MATRDVVFTFFATPGKDAAVMQPVSLFKAPPFVFPVQTTGTDKGGHPVFSLAREGGRALPALLRAAASKCGAQPDRVAVVGFSAGRSGVQQLLEHPADRAAIDTVIDLDGLHFLRTPGGAPAGQIDPWVEFGRQCFDASHLLALLHTAIVPANSKVIFSTTESNDLLWKRLAPILGAPGHQQQPWDEAQLTKGPPPPSVTVNDPQWGPNGKVSGYKKVVYDAMPPFDVRSAANYFCVGMPGQRPADHIFAANWGQRAIWQAFLAPRWNAGEGVVSSFDGRTVLSQTTRILGSDLLPGSPGEFDVPGEQAFAEGVDEPEGAPPDAAAADDGGVLRPLGWTMAALLGTYAAWRAWGKQG